MKKNSEASLGWEKSFFYEKELIIILEEKGDAILIPLRCAHCLQVQERKNREESRMLYSKYRSTDGMSF